MPRWKKIIRKLLYPGKILSVLIPLICFALLGEIFFSGKEESYYAYPIYVLSIYSLVLIILGSIPLMRQMQQKYSA